jgi:hypothetical protein
VNRPRTRRPVLAPDNPTGLSQSTLVAGHAPNRAATEAFDVQVTTLDDVFAPKLQRYVSFIKIDAEGAAYDILAGGRNFFAVNAPLVAIEFVASQLALIGRSPDEFFDLADEIGYVFYNLDGSPYDRDFVRAGENFHCYERLGAKKGHWTEAFLRDKMSLIVERAITLYDKQLASASA